MSTNGNGVSRRSFLQGSLVAAGAASLLSVAGVLGTATAFATDPADVTAGDIAILKFLAAAELIEDDLWQQYCELAVDNREYNTALRRIDRSLVRYICDDRDDERSHAHLINAFLQFIGEEPVNLDAFRVLPSVQADGAQQVGRLTSLTNLTVDTSWYNRYRGVGNPDLGDSFEQIVTIKNRTTVPTSRNLRSRDAKAAAYTACFHFCAIEQGGASLYTSLLPKVTNLDVLRILAAIGPTEFYHFAAFHKSLERQTGFDVDKDLVFPDFERNRNLSEAIFPEPCAFLSRDFPLCSIVRPSNTENAGAVAAATGLVQSGLFAGQSQAFFDAVVALATAADAAQRQL